MDILFVGEKLTPAAPSSTWRAALQRQGAHCTYCDIVHSSWPEFHQQVKQCDIIIFQWYGLISSRVIRRLAYASTLGKPIIRKWSGTDVLSCIQKQALSQRALIANRFITLNLSSEHQGLIEELASIGIRCHLTPQVIQELPSRKRASNLNRGNKVLIYLPSHRLAFYHAGLMRQTVESNPDLTFVVVADDSHSLQRQPNVQSLGWVKDMSTVWPEIGALIRITTHDGFPRSIVEALIRGVYVIHNQRLPGCWLATELSEINSCLQEFRAANSPNHSGLEAVALTASGGADQALYKQCIDTMHQKPHRAATAWAILVYHCGRLIPVLLNRFRRMRG